MSTAIFCHGLESGPIGRKSQALQSAGIPLATPDFRGMALSERVEHLLTLLDEANDAPVLIGSSYGGIAALCAAILHCDRGGEVHGILLCAPALARSESPANRLPLRAPAPTHIIHGIRDDVVPIDVSRRFAEEHSAVTLEEVDDDHFLAASIERITTVARSILAS